MNCDQAFDLMTDAEASQNPELAEHLDECPRCRQMQETLAPALGFLSPREIEGPSEAVTAVFGELLAGSSKKPFITVEAVKVARHAARELAKSSERPRDRWLRLGRRSLAYASVFAAGLLLALALVPDRDAAAIPSHECTRAEVLGNDRHRSDAEVRALVLSCAACHVVSPDAKQELPALERSTDRHSTWLELRRNAEFEWLGTLESEMLVADSGCLTGLEPVTFKSTI